MKKNLLFVATFSFALLINSCTKQSSTLSESEIEKPASPQSKPSNALDISKPTTLTFLNKLGISKEQVNYYYSVALPQKNAKNIQYKNPYTLEQIMNEFGLKKADAEKVTAEKTSNFNAEIIKRFGSFKNWYIAYKIAIQKKEINRKEFSSSLSGDFVLNIVNSNNGDYMTFMGTPFYYIMDALEVQGYQFDQQCDRAGVGPTCVSYLMEGGIDDSEQSYLDDCERDGNWFLPCVTYQASQALRIGIEAETFFDIWSLFHCA